MFFTKRRLCLAWRRALPLLAVAASLFPSAAGGQPYLWQAPTQFPLPAEKGPHPPELPMGPPEPEPSFMDGFFNGLIELGRRAEHTHDRLQDTILQQAIRLDDFFGTMNSTKELRTAYLLRWRSDIRVEDDGNVELGSTARVDLQLSRVDERLRITFAGENEPDPFAPRLPEDPGNPGFDRTLQNTRIVNTEVRYQLIRSDATSCFVGSGLDLHMPLQIFVRGRYQHTFRLTDLSQLRFAETLFAKSSDGFGETTELSVERSLTPKSLLRLANTGTVSEEIGALEWGSELSLLHELSSKDGINLTAGVYGETGEPDWVNHYRLFLRYRRNFLRPWLFYELEPELSWPREDDGSFPTTYAFTFRIEVVFQGREKKH